MYSSVPPSLLYWCKLVSFGITSVLALLGLLFDFKDKDTRELTTWGRVNLAGLILSFIVGVVSQNLEDMQKSAAAEDARLKSDAALANDQETLHDLEAVIKANDLLLTNTRASLERAKSIQADTEQTLGGVNRALELVGNSITVDYQAVLFPEGQEIQNYRQNVLEFKNTHPQDKITGFRHSAATLMAYTGDSIQFGQGSQVVPEHAWTAFNLDAPEFELWFQNTAPVSKGRDKQSAPVIVKQPANGPSIEASDEEFAAQNASLSAKFIYDPDKTKSSIAWRSAEENRGPTKIQFHLDKPTMALLPNARTIFQREEPLGDYLSARDFAGKYIVIHRKGITPMAFCGLTLEIGGTFLRVPADKLLRTSDGLLFYKLPATMRQAPLEISRGQIGAFRCMQSLTESHTELLPGYSKWVRVVNAQIAEKPSSRE